jgi:uncharacterized protein
MADARSTIQTTPVVGRTVTGPVIRLVEPLSFWGGFDSNSGRITDRNHQQYGTRLTGAVVVMSATRGSSSSTSTLLEAIRVGSAPAAFILETRDPFVVVAAAAAWEIYGRGPTIVLTQGPSRLETGIRVEIAEDGRVTVDPVVISR